MTSSTGHVTKIFETSETIQIAMYIVGKRNERAFQPAQNQLHTLIRSNVMAILVFSLLTDLVTGDLERKLGYWK